MLRVISDHFTVTHTHTHARFFPRVLALHFVCLKFYVNSLYLTRFRWLLKRTLEHPGQGREANCSATQQILSSLPSIDRLHHRRRHD